MYKIHVLSNDDFDSLPETITRGSDISMSLGFADPKTKQAYVRYTGVDDLDKYLINHEFEELVQHESSHEDENGIRHKGFGDVVKTFFNPLNLPVPGLSRKDRGFAGIGESRAKKERDAQEQLAQQNRQSGALGRFASPGSSQPGVTASQVAGGQPGSSVVGRLGGGTLSGGGLNEVLSQLKDRRKFGFFAGRSV